MGHIIFPNNLDMYCQVYEREVSKERPKANKKGRKIKGAEYWWEITISEAKLWANENEVSEMGSK